MTSIATTPILVDSPQSNTAAVSTTVEIGAAS